VPDVVDEDVDAAITTIKLGKERIALSGIGDIGVNPEAAPPCFGEEGERFPGTGVVDIADEQIGPGIRQRQRNRAADTGSGTGNQRHPASEIEETHDALPSFACSRASMRSSTFPYDPVRCSSTSAAAVAVSRARIAFTQS